MGNKIKLSALKEKRKEILKAFNLPTKILGIPAPYISYLFIRFTNISANQITMFWIILQTFGISIIALGRYEWTIAGIIISHIAMMLDQVDGDIARARKKFTIGGPYLDEIAQLVNRSVILLAVGIGLYSSGLSIIYFYLGSVASLVFVLTSSIDTKMRQVLLERGLISKLKGKTKESIKSKIWLKKILSYFRPAEPMNIVYIALVFNLLNIAGYILIAYSILIPLLFARKFYLIYKKAGNLKNG